MKIHCFMILPFVCFTSCATITRGVHEKLSVMSDPSGADVRLSTGEYGVTPAKFVKLRRTEPFTVTVSKSGYLPQTVKIESKFGGTGGAAMAGNVILGGAIGLGVDAGTGAYNSLYPNPVSVHLTPTAASKSKSKTSKRSTTSTSVETPRAKSKTTKSPVKSPPEPKIETAPRSESESIPTSAPTSTPYVPPTLETSPSP